MAPKIDEVNAEVQMMKAQTAEFRTETRGDFLRIFDKLEAIHNDLATLKAQPVCPDPGACVRVENALVDQNRRLGILEADKQAILGGKTLVVGGCVVVGFLVQTLISWFHK